MVKKYVLRRADARALIDLKVNEGVIKRGYNMINHDLYVLVLRLMAKMGSLMKQIILL